MNPEPTTTGTIADVAAFFRVSVRTVAEWKAERPPRLAFWQEGRNVCFGEESVVALRAKMLVASSRLQPGEAESIARKEWRAHLGVRLQLDELSQRLTRLESAIQTKAIAA